MVFGQESGRICSTGKARSVRIELSWGAVRCFCKRGPLMTLQEYASGDLDAFALRLLDLAAIFREMGRKSQEEQLTCLPLNDRKAQEWCTKLEHWALRARAEFDTQLRIHRAERRAQTD